MTHLTPLEPWIAAKIGLKGGEPLTRSALAGYQLSRLRETVAFVKKHSPFYRQLLRDIPPPDSLEDLACFPFTTQSDLREDDQRFICVSRGEIERVVTLRSSGTTAPAKRLHFTAEDLELTVDFFHHGMGTMVEPAQKVLILMPGELPGSVGDLLARGLARMDAQAIIHGPVIDAGAALRAAIEEEIDCLVGLPVQLLGLARHPAAAALAPGRLKSILLSADYAPAAVVNALSRTWNVPVFDHYGMTEMGLGGCVECRHRSGYHPREADLYFEIVDPQTGQPLPDGNAGEVTFSTLTRRGMPLIRYRTGDLARFLVEPCPCGTVLRRMERIRGRTAGSVRLAGGGRIGLAQLDEVLFPLPFLLDYQAGLTTENEGEVLAIRVKMSGMATEETLGAIRRSLLSLPAIDSALSSGILSLDVSTVDSPAPAAFAKRAINDRRGKPLFGSVKSS